MLQYFKVRFDLFTGVLYALKTMNESALSITATSINIGNYPEIYPKAVLDDPSMNTYYQTADRTDSFLYISIIDDYRVFATHYAIQPVRINNHSLRFFPQSYKIEGKTDLGWNVLDARNITKEQIKPDSLIVHSITPGVYSGIRIWMEALNLNGDRFSAIQRLDVFGTLCSSPKVCVGNLYPKCQTLSHSFRIIQPFIAYVFLIKC